MPGFLKQATASQSRALGPFVSSTDFLTVQTGLTIANTDIKLVVNGGASANKNSGGGTHRVNGVYGVTFDATDTATVGEMEVSVVVSGALPVFDKFYVVEEAVFDALFAGSAPGYLQPTVAGRTLDVTATGAAGVDWANVENPTTAVNLSATNIDVDQVVASVSGAVGSVTGAVGSVTARVTANTDQLAGQTVTAGAGVTFPSSVASPTNITAGTITTATNVTTVNGLAAGVITATSIAADAITDAKVASDVTIASVTGAVGSVTGNVGGNVSGSVGSVTGNVGGNVTGSVGSVATGGIAAASFAAGAIDAAAIATDAIGALELAAGAASEIATAVWAESSRTLTAIDEDSTTLDLDATIRGAVGLASANLDTQLADLPTNAELATALGTADDAVLAQVALVKAVTDKLDDTLEDDGGTYRFTANALEEAPGGLTAAAIADAVWEEAIADHSGTAGSTAEALAAAGSAGDPWSTALPGSYGAGTAGKIIGDNLNATVSSRATQTSVDDVPTNAELATALGTADDAVLAVLGSPVGASLSADIAAVKSQTAAIEADTQDIQSRLPAALVSGRIDASVGAMAANVMTAAAAAADLTTELQSGLATASALATLQTTADAIPTNAELATALGTADDAVLAQVALVKAKTDLIPAAPAAVGDIPTATENADALLNRDMAVGTDTNARSPRNALRFLRNKWSVSGATLTVTKEDDTAEAWTATVSTSAGAEPVIGSDPA